VPHRTGHAPPELVQWEASICYSQRKEHTATTTALFAGAAGEETDPSRMSYEQIEEFQEQERRKEAVDAVAEMLLVAEQIKVSPIVLFLLVTCWERREGQRKSNQCKIKPVLHQRCAPCICSISDPSTKCISTALKSCLLHKSQDQPQNLVSCTNHKTNLEAKQTTC